MWHKILIKMHVIAFFMSLGLLCYIHVHVQCHPPTSSHSRASHARVQLALDTSAVASVTQISIYGIATDDYVSFKLLIVNVFVPAVLL